MAQVFDSIRLAGRTLTATELLAGIRYGRPPAQAPSVSRDEARERSSTAPLWPDFVAPPLE